MLLKSIRISAILLLIFLIGCNQQKQQNSKSATENNTENPNEKQADSIPEEKEEEPFRLTEDNAIPFFFEYEKEHKEDRVRVTTNQGSFVIKLFENTPYHRANFIYLAEKDYFSGTYFHRVVKDFIIQGGNSDNRATGKKRKEIGRYLLPPDTRKGHKHHRGTVSMPSSEINNPHLLASPFEFFIVVTRPGSYHLDGKYTAFGRVVEGMDIVDKINSVATGSDEWPLQNVVIEKVEIVK
ncbi:peptidylprolyl isomerase [Leptobacterium flavescens]|uniref:Peptidyl-prolyl cis-trans isomerase n=1 Tax=Leptobacterium flavescens TaxID=472055 RepID=A0A6P0UNS0_9FLAO|nr:peptidylprolyl isomerase [Leptobacterium flavescens]NER14090.1 peptidylprolyl isomerase [Leptobacterium flavescens]